ncbi:MAG: T9SS type A sorting domain-containing protein, partial [Bacteroidales bacterium]|nr:T9SS type A sorting domain-containing protein [Bacteroidales bacterium]
VVDAKLDIGQGAGNVLGTTMAFSEIKDKRSVGVEIDNSVIDGQSVGAVPTYTFANVTENHTIEVIFTEGECAVPTYAWTDPISNVTATLNWTDMNVTSYTVRYKLASDTVYTVVPNITDNFYELSGLEENAEYVWNVKSVCVADVAESNWTAQQSFRTEGAEDTAHIGIQDIDLGAMNVYSQGSDIYVVNNSNEQINNVQVFDINGRMVYNGAAQSNPTVINVNAANGIYVVRVTTNAMVRNYKVSISQR